jgi:hypothetical protein
LKGRGRLIGLTKGGMNTKLHAIAAPAVARSPLYHEAGNEVGDYTGAAALMNGLPEAG